MADKKKKSTVARVFKILLGVVIVAVVLVGLGLVVLYMNLGTVVKTGIETLGPEVTGAPVHLKKMDLSLLRGKIELDGLVVGNPKGFKTPSAFQLGKVLIRFQPSSLLGNTIHVKQVLIADPQITYEVGGSGTNIGAIMKNADDFTRRMGGGSGGESGGKPAPSGEKKPGKKVVIDDLRVTGGKVNLSVTLLGGNKLSVPLPEIHKTDIGKDSGGQSMGETIKDVLKSVTDGATQAAGSAAGGVKNLGSTVGGAVGTEAKSIKKEAKNALKAVKGLFGGK